MSNLQYIANRAGLPHPRVLVHHTSIPPNFRVTPATPPASKPARLRLSFFQTLVYSLNPTHILPYLRSPRVIAAACAAVAAAAGASIYLLTRHQPSEEELERQRRELLARAGRITDGTIMDTLAAQAHTEPDPTPAAPEEAASTPNIIVYNYRIAGVTYECAQDVTALAQYVHGIRTDLPIQVRYAPHNPGNSIVVAESWSGLRLKSSNPYESVNRG
jgi:hypothetical protein